MAEAITVQDVKVVEKVRCLLFSMSGVEVWICFGLDNLPQFYIDADGVNIDSPDLQTVIDRYLETFADRAP